MADEIEALLRNYNKLTNNKGAGRLSPQRDAIVRETHNEHLVRVSLEHDKPDFISGKKTWIAVVVKELIGPPSLGSTAEYVYNNMDLKGKDPENFKHCLALIPDAHDLVTPLPEDISLNADLTNPKNYIPLTMASYFYTFNPSILAFGVGSEIEVQFNDNEVNEGIILSVIKSSPSQQKAKDERKDGDGSTVGDSDTTGDGKQVDNNDGPSGKCGDGKIYPYEDCKTAPLTSTGQTVTLHPTYWNNLDNLLKTIKDNENGYIIKVGESIRSQARQLQIRKSRCPEWQTCKDMTEEKLKTAKWNYVLTQCGCKDKTPVAAVSGPYSSNHLKGLAVDLKMDVDCPAQPVSSVGYENCKKNSKVYNFMKKYADPTKIKDLSRAGKGEAWHWSYNGG